MEGEERTIIDYQKEKIMFWLNILVNKDNYGFLLTCF